MSKIARKVAKLFGSSAGPTQLGQFGSFAAGVPAYSTDPAVLQALSEWTAGWFSAIVGFNSPAIEDMNAFCYVMAYQIAYLMQEGVPEWDATTTYYLGSFAQDGNGKLYISIFDGNLNNVLTNTQYWLPYISGPYAPTIQTFSSGSGTYVPSFIFTVVSANATAGDTYTNNGQTFTVTKTISAGITLITTGTGAPATSGTLTRTSGSGDSTITFVKVTTPLYARIKLVAGGGGGAGSADSGAGGSGGDGTDTSFGTSFLNAVHGSGAAGGGASPGGLGGSGGTIPASVVKIIDIAGGNGSGSSSIVNGANLAGAPGGSTPFGVGGGGQRGYSTPDAPANSGAGGGGGGYNSNSNGETGAGGGGGEYIEVLITSFLSSYSYSVGTGGSAGAAGSGGGDAAAGGAGASGQIIIEEYYQ